MPHDPTMPHPTPAEAQSQPACPVCRAPMQATTASVAFQAKGRRMRVTFNQVPALACQRCQVLTLASAVRRHLEAIGPDADEGWALTLSRPRPRLAV